VTDGLQKNPRFRCRFRNP